LGLEKGAHRKTALGTKKSQGRVSSHQIGRDRNKRGSNEMKISKTKLIKIVNFEE
jgi:hypothetical protein